MPKAETPLPKPPRLQRQQATASCPYQKESSSDESNWEPSSPSSEEEDKDLMLLDIRKSNDGHVDSKIPIFAEKEHKEAVREYLDELIGEARDEPPSQTSTMSAYYAIDGRYVFEYSGEFSKGELESFKRTVNS